MRKLFATLASLQLAVILLILSLIALAAATIVESAAGSEVAGRTIYYALWFQLLMGLFVANLIASIAQLYPWGRRRIGFLLTHGSLVLIVVGSAITYFAKTEGQLALWEGESAAGFEQVLGIGPNPETKPHELPFTIQLEDFQIDTYPGTMRPAMFRSKVLVSDPASGEKFRYDIEMNHELSHRGWRLFQSSYEQRDGRELTVLTVSRDPGQPVVFIGFVLLIGGMCTVLATRIAQARAAARVPVGKVSAPQGLGGLRSRAPVAILIAAIGLGGAAGVASASDTIESLRRLPVQHDGRVMPLDTLAREGVWNITGRQVWKGHDPVELVLDWTFDSQAWMDQPLVKLGSAELAEAAGWPKNVTQASFRQLVQNQGVMKLVRQAREEQEHDRPLQGVLKAASKLEGRLIWMQRFLQGEIIRPVPPNGDVNAEWSTSEPSRGKDGLVALAGGPRLDGWSSAQAIDREIRYNAVRPTRLAGVILTLALIVSILSFRFTRRWLDLIALAGLVLGFAVMSWGIATRWAIAGRIPASNMFESLLFLGWGVGLFALIAFVALRNRIVVVNALAMSTLTMLLTDLLPIDGFVHPMPPVLSGTPWLAIHVPIIMTSYAVLALGVVFAHMQVGFTIFAPGKSELIAKMSELLYWYTQVGSILLITGIITGSIWASSSWGRYWGWDPKEVWSLVAFLAYIAILHARWEQMIGRFAIAAWSILAFQTILMTYLGVNFVLSAGLHSYGFGSSSVVNWMVAVAAAELLFLGWGWRASQRRVAMA